MVVEEEWQMDQEAKAITETKDLILWITRVNIVKRNKQPSEEIISRPTLH